MANLDKTITGSGKTKLTAMLVFITLVWLFSLYLYFFGQLNEDLANSVFILSSLVLLTYSSIFFWFTSGSKVVVNGSNKKSVLVEVLKVFAFALLISFNFLFALSIQNYGGSVIASAILISSIVLWVIPRWRFRFIACILVFIVGFVLAEIGFY